MKKRNFLLIISFLLLVLFLSVVVAVSVKNTNKKTEEKQYAWLKDYEAELTDDLVWEEFKPEPLGQWQKGYRLVSGNFHFNVYCGEYRDDNAFELTFAFLVRNVQKSYQLKFRKGQLEDSSSIPKDPNGEWKIVEWALENDIFNAAKTQCFKGDTRKNIVDAISIDNWKNYRRSKDDMIQSYRRRKPK